MRGSLLSQGRGPVYLIVTWIEASFALVLYILRAKHASVVRNESVSSLFSIRWDFVWVTCAVVTAFLAESFLTVSVVYGTGNHQDSLTSTELVTCNLWSWIGQIMAIIALVWGRFAVIAFVLTVQGLTHPRGRVLLFVVGAAQAIINFIEIGLILNQCTPTRRLWDPSVNGTCDKIEICSKVGFLQGSIGAFSDAFLALYPVILIGNLQQMRLTMKIGLCVVMGGGLIACAAGIVKTYQISTITNTQDITYATLDLLIFVSTEMWFIIIFGTLPTVRSIFVTASKTITARATGRSKFSDPSSAKWTKSHAKTESWVELSSRGQHNESQVIANRGRKSGLGATDSEEEILPERVRDGEIMVVRETLVRNETGTRIGL